MKPIKIKPIIFGKAKKEKKDIIEYKSDIPDIEQDCIDEMEYINKKFGEMKNKEISSFKAQTDANFYFCVYFKTKEQKEEFIENANLSDIIDVGNKYISGQQLAEKLSIPLRKVILKSKGMFKQAKRFSLDEWIM